MLQKLMDPAEIQNILRNESTIDHMNEAVVFFYVWAVVAFGVGARKSTSVGWYYGGDYMDEYTQCECREDLPRELVSQPRTGRLRVRVRADLTNEFPRLTMWINGRLVPPARDEGTGTVESSMDPAFVADGKWFPTANITYTNATLLTDVALQ